jgi:uncharacterized membrane protein HdeD (DUF308 family)
MIESFWKKYWCDMLLGSICLVTAIVFMFVEDTGFPALAYALGSVIWFSGAHIGYNRDRINALAKRVADLEAELYKEKK